MPNQHIVNFVRTGVAHDDMLGATNSEIAEALADPALAIVLVIVMLLFGNRLPGTMRSLGQSLVQFKKGMKEGDEEGSDKLQ